VDCAGQLGVTQYLLGFKHRFESSRGMSERVTGVLIDSAGTAHFTKFAVRFAIVFLSVTMAIAGYARFGRVRGNATAVKASSIAVLPFTDLSPDKEHEYFSDGLTEELIDDLAKVDGLKVVARSSAFQFKGRNEDLRLVGRKLGVTHILEGSVSVQGDHVRIRAELTKADSGFQLWSETYDRCMNDSLAVQDEIARAATHALQLQLLGSNGVITSGNPPANDLAREAYLQGQVFFGSDSSRTDPAKALAYADQAITLDAGYAPAWAQIAQVYAYRGEAEKAFEWLDLAYRRHDPGLACIKYDPLLNNVRHDPRYAQLLETMHLPKLVVPASNM